MLFLFWTLILVNGVVCFCSPQVGWVFSISENNLFIHGPLFFLPFAISGFYLCRAIQTSLTVNHNLPNKRDETIMLVLITIIIVLSASIELLFSVRYIIWCTSAICLILYYLILNKQFILFDSLTGTYGKLAYQKMLLKTAGKTSCTISVMDMNNLKKINDSLGHNAGDTALKLMSAAIAKAKTNDMHLYRFGGDEFIMFSKKASPLAMETTLLKALRQCGKVGDMKVSFSYGIVSYTPDSDIQMAIAEADSKMYEQKQEL